MIIHRLSEKLYLNCYFTILTKFHYTKLNVLILHHDFDIEEKLIFIEIFKFSNHLQHVNMRSDFS